MARVYLSLGSNLGDRLAQLRAAVRGLRDVAGILVLGASRIYETEPWELPPGRFRSECRWYLNCAVIIETTLPPDVLLGHLQAIEAALGRPPRGAPLEAARFEPRTIDIDILLYEDRVISVPDRLQVPHLLMHERAFVLRPLAELAPEVMHPTLYQTVGELLAAIEDEHIVRPGDYPARWYED